MKQVVYSREATKNLERIPANTARLIESKCRAYAADPSRLANNLKALKGEPGYLRLRVGAWRVIFKEDRDSITVVRVAPRGSAYD